MKKVLAVIIPYDVGSRRLGEGPGWEGYSRGRETLETKEVTVKDKYPPGPPLVGGR
jgi:hypothetical protein